MREADPDVAAPVRMDERRSRLGRAHHVDNGRQQIPFHLDQVDRVRGALRAVGHDHRDDLADVARAIATERPLGRLADVEFDDGGQAGRHGAEERQRLHPALEILERERADHTRGRRGRGDVDPHDSRVSVRRAEERRVEHARQDHVVDEAPLAPKKSRVLPPLHRRAEEFRAHA
jgi:hypothetical protein